MSMLKPLIRPIKHYQNIGFDIETESKNNNFYMASLFFSEEDIKIFYDKNELLDFIKNNPIKFKNSKIWAHNLSFDFAGVFLDTKNFPHFKIIQRGSDFISAKSYIYDKKFNFSSNKENHHQTSITFCDTMSFFKSSLETIGKIIKFEKMEKPDFLGRIPDTEKEKVYLEKYNINDSRVTKYFADFLQSSFNALGGEFKNTIASTSMDIFKRKYLKDEYFVPNISDLEIQYNALYGGRTEILKRGFTENRFNVYDFNSLYPSVMKENLFPNPNTMSRYSYMDIDTIKNYEGFCYIEFSYLEDSIIPYLCQRMPTKLLFPCGKLKGYYTFFEIRKALDYGYKIIKIGKGYYFRKSADFFSEFVTDMYKKRREFQKENNPLELPVKIVMNSLFGKFGQKIDRMSIEYVDNLSKEEYRESEQIGMTDFYRVKKRAKQREISFTIPILSAYTTAYARDKLYTAIEPIQEDIFYMDTDSIFTIKTLPNGSELGQLKLEYKVQKAYLIKPKFYYLLTDVIKEGKTIEKCKIKGVSRVDDFNKFYNLIKNKSVSFDKIVKFKESLIQDLPINSWHEVTKKLNFNDDKRLWKNKEIDLKSLEDSKPIKLN